MYTYNINYDLLCKSCKTLRPNRSIMVNSREKISYTRDLLIEECDNIPGIQCDKCGAIGKWIVLKIELQSDRRIVKQFIVNIEQIDADFNYVVQDGIEQYSNTELKLVFDAVSDNLMKLRYNKVDSYNVKKYDVERSAIIVIDLFNIAPLSEVNIVSNENIPYSAIGDLFIFLEEQYAPDESIEEETLKFFYLNVTEIDNNVSASIEGGHEQYSKDELEMIFDAIIKKMGTLVMENQHDYVTDEFTNDSSAQIAIELLNDGSVVEVGKVNVANMSYNTIAQLALHLKHQLAV